jgi:hypothetical protein
MPRAAQPGYARNAAAIAGGVTYLLLLALVSKSQRMPAFTVQWSSGFHSSWT